jgi:hypothetical protein
MRWVEHLTCLTDQKFIWTFKHDRRDDVRDGRNWDHNIKTNMKEIGCETMDWIQLVYSAFEPVVNTVMNLQVP